MVYRDLSIFSGTAHPELAHDLPSFLGEPPQGLPKIGHASPAADRSFATGSSHVRQAA